MAQRDSLNGTWMLDKSRGKWSMRGYLETLHVNELAIQAHEKGETETDTYHTITLDTTKNTVRIVKRSRVNNDHVVELTIGEEKVQHLQPGDRPKKSTATSEDYKTHLLVTSSLLTMNGMAHVTDVKRLVNEPAPAGAAEGGGAAAGPTTRSVLVQELTITNEQTKQTNTTIRYFNPYNGNLESGDAHGIAPAPPTS